MNYKTRKQATTSLEAIPSSSKMMANFKASDYLILVTANKASSLDCLLIREACEHMTDSLRIP